MQQHAATPSHVPADTTSVSADSREIYERPAILKRHSVQRVTLFSGAGVASVSSLTGH